MTFWRTRLYPSCISAKEWFRKPKAKRTKRAFLAGRSNCRKTSAKALRGRISSAGAESSGRTPSGGRPRVFARHEIARGRLAPVSVRYQRRSGRNRHPPMEISQVLATHQLRLPSLAAVRTATPHEVLLLSPAPRLVPRHSLAGERCLASRT